MRQTCPEWQYTNVQGYDAILGSRAANVVLRIRKEIPSQALLWCVDTRAIHGPYFKGLTPEGFPQYAGHYRGESLPCLDDYEVKIEGDPLVGHHSAVVPIEMSDFASDLRKALSDLDLFWKLNPNIIGRDVRLQRTVEVAAALLVSFLEIHPYADGNGHMGRFLLLGILARYNLFPAKFPLHPRPAPPYADLIPVYRQGNKMPLLLYILRCF